MPKFFYSPRRRVRRNLAALGGRPKKSAPSLASIIGKMPRLAAPVKSKSYTTKTYPKRQQITRVKPQGAGVTTNSYFYLSSRPSPKIRTMKKVADPNFYLTNSGQSTDCLEGFQNSSQVSWANLGDLQFMRDRVPGSSTLVVPGTTIPNTYLLESMIGEIVFTNATLATAELEIYDIVRKRDAHTATPYTGTPIAAWQQGMLNAEQTGVAQPQNFLKSSPFDSKVFQDWFKVVKRTRVQLTQGGTHRHSVNLKPNKLIDNELLQYIGADVAGLTCYTMYRFYGQPASVIPEGGGSPSVTTAAIRIDAVQSLRYKYTWVGDNIRNVFTTDNLVSNVNEQVLSLGAGEFKPNALG